MAVDNNPSDTAALVLGILVLVALLVCWIWSLRVPRWTSEPQQQRGTRFGLVWSIGLFVCYQIVNLVGLIIPASLTDVVYAGVIDRVFQYSFQGAAEALLAYTVVHWLHSRLLVAPNIGWWTSKCRAFAFGSSCFIGFFYILSVIVVILTAAIRIRNDQIVPVLSLYVSLIVVGAGAGLAVAAISCIPVTLVWGRQVKTAAIRVPMVTLLWVVLPCYMARQLALMILTIIYGIPSIAVYTGNASGVVFELFYDTMTVPIFAGLIFGALRSDWRHPAQSASTLDQSNAATSSPHGPGVVCPSPDQHKVSPLARGILGGIPRPSAPPSQTITCQEIERKPPAAPARYGAWCSLDEKPVQRQEQTDGTSNDGFSIVQVTQWPSDDLSSMEEGRSVRSSFLESDLGRNHIINDKQFVASHKLENQEGTESLKEEFTTDEISNLGKSESWKNVELEQLPLSPRQRSEALRPRRVDSLLSSQQKQQCEPISAPSENIAHNSVPMSSDQEVSLLESVRKASFDDFSRPDPHNHNSRPAVTDSEPDPASFCEVMPQPSSNSPFHGSEATSRASLVSDASSLASRIHSNLPSPRRQSPVYSLLSSPIPSGALDVHFA